MPRFRKRFILYPEPIRAPDVPPKAARNPNPRIYGLFLVAAAYIMEWIAVVRWLAWENAGFGSLHSIWDHVAETEPRYDPTVFPTDEHPQATRHNDKAKNGHVPGYTHNRRSSTNNPLARRNSVAFYRSMYLSGELTPLDVVQAILPLIRRDTSPPGEHSLAFLEVRLHAVMKAAAASTIRYKEKRSLGPLDGVPTAVKDEFDISGYKTTLGSVNNYATPAGYSDSDENMDSWLVRKMEEAGAIILGKLSMHEFGLDTPGYNINFGTPRNPYNKSYYTGGSSSGPAYVVAAGLVPIALGSDGGGSVRIPASFCSIFGLKPTHGRLSFFPNPNHANTASVNGPLAADMQSLAAFYDVLKEPHPQSDFPPSQSTRISATEERLKILGIPETWFDRAEPAVQKLCRDMIDRLAKQKGYTVVPIKMPFVAEGQIAHSLTLLTDAATLVRDTKGVTPANRILLALGRTTPATDYLMAQKLRHLIMQHLAWLWQQHPGMIIVTPTTACAGWPIRSELELQYGISDGDQTIKSMEYVWLANFCGVPSITVPAGFAPPEGSPEVAPAGNIPVGLMGTGEWCSEETLIQFGADAEEVGMDLQRHPTRWVDVAATAKELDGFDN